MAQAPDILAVLARLTVLDEKMACGTSAADEKLSDLHGCQIPLDFVGDANVDGGEGVVCVLY